MRKSLVKKGLVLFGVVTSIVFCIVKFRKSNIELGCLV